MPSAKMTVWNEAMYYFHIAPALYWKIFFVLKHIRKAASISSVLACSELIAASSADQLSRIHSQPRYTGAAFAATERANLRKR